ncbi:MAG: hypothetical protein IKT00_03060 [Prevotella sp.]|nr:hypothetical protein [Prevotella sp.]
MKKLRLCLAAFAAMVGLSASAQLTDGTVYWLQDAATGQFISGGANWGTRAVVKDVGGLGFEATAISEGVYTLKNIMLNKVHNASKGLGDNYFVDNGSPAQWTIAASGEGYTISLGDTYLCNNGDYSDLNVRRLGTTTDASAATVWKFLTKTEYEAAIQAYKDGKAAAIATSAGLEDVSSVAALEAVLTDVDQFISKNVTSSITNATLADNWNGWTHGVAPGSNRSEGAGQGSGCVEFWNGVGYAKQTVSGLANGIYKVQFAGTYRPGNSDPAKNVGANNTSSPAFGYANDEKVELIHWIDEPTYANNRGGIKSAYDNGKYINTIYTYVSDGTLELGVIQDYWNNDNNYQWCPFGQFTLTYYTNQVTDEEIAALVATIPTEDIPTAVTTNLNTLKETLESSKTIAAFNELSNAINEANAISEVYTKYPIVKARMQTIKNASGYTDSSNATEAFDAVIAAQDEAVENATTIAGVEDAIEAVRAAAGTFLGAVEITGTVDATALIMNDTPTSNGDFWTVTGSPGYDTTNNVAEYWSQSGASIKQTVVSLPKGYYTLTAVALARPDQTGVLSANENTVNLVQHFEQPSGNTTEGGNWFNAGNGVNTLSFSLENATNVEIGITADNATGDHWTLWRNFKLEYYGTDPLAADKALYQEALANAQEVDDSYTVVTGEEATALDEALTTYGNVVANYDDVEGSKTALQEATAALNTAAQTVKDAAPSYEAYNAEKEKAVIIGLTNEIPAATNAAAAVAAVNTMKVAESTFVNTNYPADITSLVGNLSTWTGSSGTGTSNDQHWSGTTKTYYEQGSSNWSANAWEISYTKTVTLPAGKYMAKVAARGSAALTYSELSVSVSKDVMPLAHKGDSGKGIATDGTTSFDEGTFTNNGNGRGWEWGYLPFELTEESEVTFTLASKAESNRLWVSYCDFALLNVLATAEDYAALEEAKPTDIVLGFEEGEYAPYNNLEAAAALELANGIDPEAANAQVAVQLATNTLETTQWVANEEEVNAVHNGLFATVQEGANYPEGWTRTNGWGQMQSGVTGDYATAYYNQPGSLQYGNNGGYIMPLKANTTYTLKFAYRSHENNSNKGITVSVLNGEDGVSGKTFPANGSTTNWETATMAFTTGAAGNYVLTLANGGNTWMTGVEIFKAQPVEIAIKAGRQYTAFSCEWPLDFSDTGLTAQIVTSAKGATQDVTKVPANTGVIVGLAEATTEATTIQVPVYGGETDDVEANMLVAVVESATVTQTEDYTNYVFGKKNGKEAFYKIPAAGIEIPANNAYLAVPAAAGAKEVIFLGGETTGINNVDADTETGDLYNLSGVKVKKAQKGVYIQNGKKVVVK